MACAIVRRPGSEVLTHGGCDTPLTQAPSQRSGSTRAGTVTLALGIFVSAAVVFTYVLSLSDVVNPPN